MKINTLEVQLFNRKNYKNEFMEKYLSYSQFENFLDQLWISI